MLQRKATEKEALSILQNLGFNIKGRIKRYDKEAKGKGECFKNDMVEATNHFLKGGYWAVLCEAFYEYEFGSVDIEGRYKKPQPYILREITIDNFLKTINYCLNKGILKNE